MTTQADKAAHFLELHRGASPLLLANAWDVGSAKLLASAGFQALATTSSGYAASLGRLDYGVTREEAHAGPVHLVLTARAENHLRGNPDVRDTIARLQAYERAGADVLYAPALDGPEDLRELLAAVELPVNVLARAATPPVAELAALGVKRVSVGGGFAFAAYGAAVKLAGELLGDGTYGFTELSAPGAKAARTAFG